MNNLSNRQKQALRELKEYDERKRPYWWMPKTMKELELKGLAERYMDQHIGLGKPKEAWRITDAGRKANHL